MQRGGKEFDTFVNLLFNPELLRKILLPVLKNPVPVAVLYGAHHMELSSAQRLTRGSYLTLFIFFVPGICS